MDSSEPRLLTYSARGGTWLTRIVIAGVGLMLAVAAFFFITLALIAGAFFVLILMGRWWWTLRRLRAEQQAAAPLDGEYQVVPEREVPQHPLER